MKYLKYLGLALIALLILYLLGPKVHYLPIDYATPAIRVGLEELDSLVASEESTVTNLKPGNEEQIIWADTIKKKTPYSLIYMHGFSASHEEGAPIHQEFAKRYGMNLLLTRLADHGRADDNTFKGLTPDTFFESAQHALEIGKLLGDSIIIMSCSTGGTLSIMLDPTCDLISGYIMYSPNIDIKDPTTDLLIKPWGKQIMDLVMHGEYNHITYTEQARKFWNPTYHTDGILALKTMLEENMTNEKFQAFTRPFFLGYYYKDKDNQDDVVSIDDMMRFYEMAGTREPLKRKVCFPNAGAHVISSYVFSKELDNVKSQTYKFAEEILHLKPVQSY